MTQAFYYQLSRGSMAPEGWYYHWDTLRRMKPPEGMTRAAWWAGIKLVRRSLSRDVALQDVAGNPFSYTIPDPMLAMLHRIDRLASGTVSMPEPVTNAESRTRYIQSTLIEEAITSSMMEGAVATRKEAREMIRTGRLPRTHGERMILNNYRAMEHVRSHKHQPLTPEFVVELREIVTAGTVPEESSPFRQPGDGTVVYDNRDDVVLHRPPPAETIEERLVAMCDFANRAEADAFLHPVVKAIILHFWLAYDHPFSDGNGRTARALFYWMMLRQDFWLVEFISISSILRQASSKYARSFLYTETDDNDLTYFVLAQLRVIERSIDALYEYLERKVAEMREVTALTRASVELNARQRALVAHAMRTPDQRYTIESHRTSHRVTYETARTDLLDLEARGLLERRTVRRAFVFTPAPGLADRLRALR